jgi:hypothetical protein
MDMIPGVSAGNGATSVQTQLFATTPADVELDSPVAGLPRKRRSRKRRRQSLFPFPDPDDAQLTLIRYPRKNSERFTDADIVALHDGVLRLSLRYLEDGRGSKWMHQRVLEWVCKPMVLPRQLTDLFSLQAMCYVAGLDPEVVQEEALRRFAPERLQALGYAHR